MFRHEDAPICIHKSKCSNKLCQFKHSKNDKKNQYSCDKCDFVTDSAEIIKTHNKECHITKYDQQIEDKQIYDCYMETNFAEIYNLYLTNQNCIHCYFCDYVSKGQSLKHIKTDITRHLEANHETLIEDFKSDNAVVENLLHLEFLEFFVPE